MSKKKQQITPSAPQPNDSRSVRPKSDSKKRVRISFEYIKPGSEYCLCKHDQQETRNVMDCLRQLTTLQWIEVIQTGGKGKNKVGLAFTIYDDTALSTKARRPSSLSPDLRISAVRASKKARIFGAHGPENTYYILWFDRNHEIVKS